MRYRSRTGERETQEDDGENDEEGQKKERYKDTEQDDQKEIISISTAGALSYVLPCITAKC